MRKTILGESVPVLDQGHQLSVYTRSPHKYLLIDLETGQVYRGQIDESRDWLLIGGEDKRGLLERIWSALKIRKA